MGQVCLRRIFCCDNVLPQVACVEYWRGSVVCLHGYGRGICCKNKDGCGGTLSAVLFSAFYCCPNFVPFPVGWNSLSICCMQSRMALILFTPDAMLPKHIKVSLVISPFLIFPFLSCFMGRNVLTFFLWHFCCNFQFHPPLTSSGFNHIQYRSLSAFFTFGIAWELTINTLCRCFALMIEHTRRWRGTERVSNL